MAANEENVGTLKQHLAKLFEASLRVTVPDELDVEPLVAACHPRFGDFQCNNAMSLWTKIKGKGSEFTGPQPIGKVRISIPNEENSLLKQNLDATNAALNASRNESFKTSTDSLNELKGELLHTFSGLVLQLPIIPQMQSCSFCDNMQPVDLTAMLRGGYSTTYLIVKCFALPHVEIFDVLTSERSIIVEGETPLQGFYMIGYSCDSWLLLQRGRSVYYLNIVTRQYAHLPNLDWDVNTSAYGAFQSSPFHATNITAILDLNFYEVRILVHMRRTGWRLHNLGLNVATNSIDCLSFVGNRLFWVAARTLYCCSINGVEWFLSADEFLPLFAYFSSSFVRHNRALYLLFFNGDMSEKRLFLVRDDGDEGFVEEIVGIPGVIFTSYPMGGNMYVPNFPFEDPKIYCAGILLPEVECFEYSEDDSRVLKTCEVAEYCICDFGWVRLGPEDHY